MADYERTGQTLPENATNSEFSKCQVFDLRWTSTDLSIRVDGKVDKGQQVEPFRIAFLLLILFPLTYKFVCKHKHGVPLDWA